MTAVFARRNHGQGHTYRLDDPDQPWGQRTKVPGVTSILNAGVPKPGLVGWASSSVAEYVVDRLKKGPDGQILADDLVRDIRAGAKYPVPAGLPRVKLAKELSFAPNRERDAGGLKGQQVHDIARTLAETGEWTPTGLDEHLEGYADAIVDWWHHWDPSGLVLVERSVLNRDAFYAGTFDLYAEGCGGRGRCLIDWKSGQSGIFGETALQLAAYRYADSYLDDAEVEQPMPEVDRCLGVWLRSDGTWETYELAAGPDMFRLFRYAYELAKFLTGPELFGLDGDAPVRTAKSEPIFPTAHEAAS